MKNVIKLVMILCLFSISCKEKQGTPNIDSLKIIVDNNLGKKLIIPDSLETYFTFSNSQNKKKMLSSELKIYSHIDASCGTCIDDLNAWNKLIPEFNNKDVEVFLLCTSDDNFELLKYFIESKEINDFNHHLFLDYNNQYVKENQFMLENKNFETVLINDNNEILLMGDPIYSKKMREVYFNEIEKHVK